MSDIPADLKYTKSHEWVRTLANGNVEVGITDHAQGALGDLVFVEVPEAGKSLKAGDSFAVVESVKAASDVYAPIAGAVRRRQPRARQPARADQFRALRRRLDRAHEAGRRAAGLAERRRIPGASRRGGLIHAIQSAHARRTSATCSPPLARRPSKSCSMKFPKELRIESLAGIPDALNEMQTGKLMMARAAQDGTPLNFIGAGAYEHHIPSAVWAVTTRGEFYSAYTPYQAEASQGTLQLIYEYQTMISSLTGMEVSNASLYDGGSAVAEASLMSDPRAPQVASRSASSCRPPCIRTTARWRSPRPAGRACASRRLPARRGTCRSRISKKYEGEDITAIVIQQPNFFGVLEDVDAITDWAHANGALVIGSVNPTSLAILKPPGEWGTKGADIACGDCQPLGVPLSSGGPYAGFLTTKMEYRAPDAGPHRRPHRRRRRPPGLRAHAAGARAAHPPRQGHLQHLHQPGPAGHGCDDLPRAC